MDPVPNEKPADGSRSEQAVPMPDEPPAYNPEWIDPQNKQYAAMVLTEYRDYNLPLPHGPVTVADASSKVSIVPTCPECVSGLVHEQFTTCGFVCAICFFPFGVLCCLSLRERVCLQCKAKF